MEASELMLSDWVRIDHPYAPCKGQVVAIHDDVIEFVYNKQDDEVKYHIMEADIEEVQPIPLTAEILERNGFEIVYGEYQDVFYCYNCLDLLIGTNEFLLFGCVPCSIKYVHELQHALRFCKINKEIEL